MELLNDRLELVAVDEVKPHPRNARQGDVDFVEGLIEQNGFFGALVVQRSTGHILVGNHRYLAAKKAGADSLPVLYVDVDDERAMKIMLSDNRANDRADYDRQILVELLQEMDADGSYDGSGYGPDDTEDLLAMLDKVALTSEQPFEGGFADAGQEPVVGGRANVGAAGAPAPKEVVLFMKPDDHAMFIERVKVLQRAFGTTSTISTIAEAVRREVESVQ